MINKNLFVIYFCLVTAFVGLSQVAGLGQVQPSNRKTGKDARKIQLFGIILSSKALKLLKEVESLYGRSIVESDYTKSDMKGSGEAAGSVVLADGSPQIIINSESEKHEGTIVHELFHLKLRAKGFSGGPAICNSNDPGCKDAPIFNRLRAFIFDPLQHLIIYPKMRRMGYDPDKSQRDEMIKQIKEGKIEGVNKSNILAKTISLTFDYFAISLQSPDKKLLSEMKELYKKLGLNESLKRGEEMLNIVKSAKKQTPESQIELFIKCLNILYKDEASFTFSRWEYSIPSLPKVRRGVVNFEIIKVQNQLKIKSHEVRQKMEKPIKM